jgi:hypothetical protein
VTGLPWRETRPYDCSVTGAEPRFSTASFTVNMNLSSTAIVRRKTRPCSFCQVRVTGLPGVSEVLSAVQTVFWFGRLPAWAPTQPNSA